MRTPVLLLAIILALSGCQQTSEPDTADGIVTDMPEAASDEVTGTEAGPDFALDQPIPEADIRTTLELAEPPAYRAADDALLLKVRVGNQGNAALVGEGAMPVQLGATLAGPEGVDTKPGRRDFVRARLPLIQPGSTAVVPMNLPAAEILGMDVKLELVQERVGWFGRSYDQPVLDVGTFQRCDGAEDSLCDASGTPVGPADAGTPANPGTPAEAGVPG